MFPIYLKDQDPFPPPPEPTYFLLARHGVYLVKRSPLYDAVTKCEEELPTLAAQCPQLRLKIPQFPQSMFEAVVGFFVEVFQRYQTEAIVMLFYAPARGFRVLVPPQQVRRWAMGADSLSTDHVQYQHLPRPQGYLQLGSIHSHGALPATHSCLDVLDERYLDGLHMTVGELTAPRPSFCAVFAVNGHRFPLPAEDVLAGYARPRLPAPAHWLAQVTCRTYQAYDGDSDHNGLARRAQDDIAPTGSAGEDGWT